MAATDRVFRAYGRASPEALVDLARRFVPGLVPPGVRVTPMEVDDPHLEAPLPVRDADWIARAGPRVLLHVECQGYRDPKFLDRVFDYHLRLVARYPRRRVHTIALWVIHRPASQRVSAIERKGIRIRISSLVLSQLPAASLLQSPRTACFAAGADAGRWTADELCRKVARVLKQQGASYHSWAMAMAMAATRKRGKAMVKAMKQEEVEPVILEDLVKIGEDWGIEKGRAEGFAEALATAYRSRFRKALPVKLREAIAATQDAAVLNGWLEIVVTGSARELREAVLGKAPPRRAAHA
jgi:hypothetical protein